MSSFRIGMGRTNFAAVLIAAAAALVWCTGCIGSVEDPVVLASPPTFDGAEQVFATLVDEGRDGVLEAEDSGTVVTGGAAPGQLSQAAATNSATLFLTNDFDSIILTCEHDVRGAAGLTQCSGTARGEFTIPGDQEGDETAFSIALVVVPGEMPANFLSNGLFNVEIECGATLSSVQMRAGLDVEQQLAVDVAEDASVCSVEIVLDFSETISEGQTLKVSHALSVTAVKVETIECMSDHQCPGGMPICGPQNECQHGGTGDTCVVASVHCDPSRPICTNQCSAGFAASPCRWQGECADGYVCDAGSCRGTSCATDADCTDPAAPVCTDLGCSGEGRRGDGCFSGFGCGSGLCISNVCIDILAPGTVCTVPDSVCAGGTLCRTETTGTCEEPLAKGEPCTENPECMQPFDSCISLVCAARSTVGGACEENADCTGGVPCDADAGVCGF